MFGAGGPGIHPSHIFDDTGMNAIIEEGHEK